MEDLIIKALLVAVNAKYIHTNLAVRSIAAFSHVHFNMPLEFVEFTINQRPPDLLRELYFADAECYLFSCYIWNIEIIKQLVKDLKKLKPAAVIVLGGPEADWQAKELLESMPQIDYIVCGEGESRTPALIKAIVENTNISLCAGICMRKNGKAVFTQLDASPDLGEIPFPYSDLDSLNRRVPYYESMRGCPFSCSYCLSARDRRVRYRPIEMVFDELRLFLDKRVPQVKFVDRTFNCNIGRALKIWRFLAENDNGTTNFHFEMAGDLLSGEAIDFLAAVRPGLFQFEIGVQSTNPKTLESIDRTTDFAKLTENVNALNKMGNIHLHLDLIAGLPFEDFESFKNSFNTVYSLRPQQLQLGFLKLLGGSKVRAQAESYGMLSQEKAPYETFCTNWISYSEMCILHGIDEMVDTYYNSGRFSNIIAHIAAFFASPFDFYRKLWEFFAAKQGGNPLSKIGYYDLLGDFMDNNGIPKDENAQWLCKYDLLLHEKPRKLPDWVKADLSKENAAWLNPLRKEHGKDIYIEIFPFHPADIVMKNVTLAFDYSKRDITGRALVFEIL